MRKTRNQIKKYYLKTAHNTVGRFLSTYQKIILTMEKGKEPTPADLYKLDKYWQLQNELRKELNKLGNYQVKLCGTDFLKFYKEIYDNVAIKDSTNFHHASKEMMTQVINHIWCADGKNWSQRIWDNTDKLQQALNDELISCLLAGVAPRQLRERLMSEFSVSFDCKNRNGTYTNIGNTPKIHRRRN